MPSCSKCGKRDARLLCSRCKCAHYCSQECQYEHWAKSPHPHRDVCRECRSVGGVFFEGLQKSSILDLANGKGGNIVRKLGYSALTANAMALRVSRAQFLDALRHARGELNSEWQDILNFEEKQELSAQTASSETEYVRFASPMTTKKRKSDVSSESSLSRKAQRASDVTPIKGTDLFDLKRERKPSKRYVDDALKDSAKRNRVSSKDSHYSAESDQYSDGELDYTELKGDALIGTDCEEYIKVLDRIFEDTEDGVRFLIVNICVSSDPTLGFFFKYCEADSDATEFEYTPCSELMEASWVKWCDDDVTM